MAFPDLHGFPVTHPSPYERQMGDAMVLLLRLFTGRVPDSESNTRVLELAADPAKWSAGYAVVDEVRRRLLAALKANDAPRQWQHYCEESCCLALYNATNPPAPFDPSSAFFVAGQAVNLARVVGVPVEAVVAALAPVIQTGT